MKKLYILLIFCSQNVFGQGLSVDQKVDSLLNLMTLDEKIGQMTQAERGALEKVSDIGFYSLGSLLSGGGSGPDTNLASEWAKMYDGFQAEAAKSRLKIPIIYGIDAVHGHNNVKGAVIFPHNIGLGSTWNTELVKKVNQITAKEVAATGIDWTFSPCIAVPRNEQWGRTYEGFGETAELQKIMSLASVVGLQGNDLSNPETIAACAKHFVGDGGTTNGTDQGNTEMDETTLRSVHMPGYIDAINAKVGTVMASYSSWNGVKLHGHDYLLNTVLKDELGFEGFVISDWKGVDQINEDYRVAVKRAINSGIDMVMVPDRYIYFISILKDLVEKNEVSINRIDDAVKRILKQKFLLNLFKKPMTDMSLVSSVGSAAHRSVARQAVRESLVLLSAKNNVLPLKKDNQKILVAGKLASDLGAQCGGWSISWQGDNGNITEGTNILQGIKNMAGSSEVVYSESGDTSGSFDVAVVVIGENPYAEGAGDRTALKIENDQVQLVKKLKESGMKVITILISGRPLIISEILPYTDAFIAAWLPGTEGDGVADILFGDYNPTGLSSHTWPAELKQIPINFGDQNYNPLFAYKHGLTYFPGSEQDPKLNPYAAYLNASSTQILLTVTDKISDLNYTANDFLLKTSDEDISSIIENVVLSENDKTVIEINLSSPISTEESIYITYVGNGISAANIALSQFQDFFVFNGTVDYGTAITIPGRVEAENFVFMSGVGIESTTDVGGGENIGWIDNGDWFEYFIDVTESGEYELIARMAGYNSATLSITVDNESSAEINFSPTDGWQNWQDFKTNITLEKGEHILRATANAEAININYFDFNSLEVLSLNRNEPVLSDISVFPNPMNSNFKLQISSKLNSQLSINLFDMAGKKLQSFFEGKIDLGHNEFSFNLDPRLNSNIYFLEIKDESRRFFQKIVKN